VVTYTVSFGLDGSITNSTPGIDPATGMPASRLTAFNWPNPQSGSDTSIPQKIDDLMHAAFNGRGEFLSAKQPQELLDALDAAINSISDRTSSASSVALNSGSLNTGTSIFQARFNSGDWTGELLAFPISAGPGLTPGCSGEAIGKVCPKAWNAADVLKLQTPASRNIFTMATANRKGPGVAFNWASLDAVEQGFLNFNVDTNAADTKGPERVDYLRGVKTNEAPNGFDFRPRTTPLGDIINSDPIFAGAPNQPFDGIAGYTAFRSTHQNRTGMVYVGANDGKLHGFRASDGNERFAFIPGERGIYEDLSGLTSQSYNARHRFFVDGSPEVSDAEVSGAWKTVLVSGMRTGGQGLFALDVTNPDTFGVNNVMWQFTDYDDLDLGYTHAKATIVKTQIAGKWAAIVGNGYNNSRSTFGSRNLNEPDNVPPPVDNVSNTGEACLFIIFLDGPGDQVWASGTEYKKICVTSGGPDNTPATGTPNGLSTPAVIDRDGDFIADFVYAGDLEGNLWKFDISTNSLGLWGVALAGQPLFRACSESNCSNRQQITSRPEVGLHPDGPPDTFGLLVYFGTGRYIATGDNSATGQLTQSFYIVWDTVAPQSPPLDRADLVEQTINNEQKFNGSACDAGNKAGCLRFVSNNTVTLTIPPASPNLGCFMDFQKPPVSSGANRGERV
ncbi:MAG: pilus assembly protein, partial [Blastocatellia bacterium]